MNTPQTPSWLLIPCSRLVSFLLLLSALASAHAARADWAATARACHLAAEAFDPSGAGYTEDAETRYLEEAMGNTVIARTPGTDTNLGMSWEQSVAVSRVNPRRMAVIQGNRLRVSTDGGDTFQPSVNVATFLPPTHTGNGDGTAAYDSQGRLFVSFLGNPTAGGGWDVFVSRHDPTDGSLISGPVNAGDQVGMVTGFNVDKPWLAADDFVPSPLTDRLYLVWAVTGGALSGDFEIWAATSGDQGATWTLSTLPGGGFGPLSPLDGSDGQSWPPHIAVARNGDVYISYHGQPGFFAGSDGANIADGVSGRITVMRSIDGGATYIPVGQPFGPGEADFTRNGQGNEGAIPDAQFWTIGNGQAWILPDPDPEDFCTLHVVAADDPDNDPTLGDASDVMMSTSTDCGITWSDPQKVDDSPAGTWQLLPTAAIDPISGAIAVMWYDNRDSASYPAGSNGNARADLRLRYSFSSGNSWFGSVRVNDTPIDLDASASTIGSSVPPTTRVGEYVGIAFGECSARMTWAGDTPAGGSMDTYYDEDPEAGGDLDGPMLFCPDNVVLGCNDPTTPEHTGSATARDTCDRDPVVDFFDVSDGGNCPPTPVIDNIFRNWTARDAAGNLSTCQQRISIQDFDPPAITAPVAISLSCNSPGGVRETDPQIVAWLDQASAVDACSETDFGISGVPDLFPVSCDGSSATFVTFSASDACGNSDFEVSSVTVRDLIRPSLSSLPANARVECSAPGGTPVDDPQVAAWLGQATSTDNCGAAPITHNAPALIPRSCIPGAPVDITFTATDVCGNMRSEIRKLSAVDTKAPEITAMLDEQTFFDPDHEYRCVQGLRAGVGVADACQSFPIDFAISCESSQCDDAPCPEFPGQDGDGMTVNDCFYDATEDRLCARAERADTDPEGRLYTVTATATDACGNASERDLLEIFVPWGCAEGDGDCVFRDSFESGNTAAWSAASP